jgi:hypothetical protein
MGLVISPLKSQLNTAKETAGSSIFIRITKVWRERETPVLKTAAENIYCRLTAMI